MKTRHPRILTRSIAALLATAAVLAPAASYAASGAWNLTTGGAWGTAANWTPVAVPGSAAGDVITIGTNIIAAAIITLDANRTVGTLNIGDSDSTHAFTLTGNQLILDQTAAGTALVRFGAAGSGAAITNVIASTIALTDNARFYTTLTAAQNLTGIISGAKALTFDNDDGVTLAGPVSNQGQFLLTGVNTYSLGTTIDDARVTITTSSLALGAAGSAVVIQDGGQVFNNTGLTAINYAFNIAGNGWLETAGQLGALRLDSGAIVTGSVTMSANAAIGTNSGTGTVNGIVSGAFALTKRGAATLALGGVNTYSGGTNIEGASGSILQLNNAAAAGTGAITWTAGSLGRLRVNGGVTIGNTINIPAGLTGVAATGLIERAGTGQSTYNGAINIAGSVTAGGHIFGSNTVGDEIVLGGLITASVPIVQRDGRVIYRGGGTGYTSLGVTGTAMPGIANGISTAAVVNLGQSLTGTLDLNGFDQSLAGVTFGNATGGNSNQGVVNLGAKTLSLTGDLSSISTTTANVSHAINAVGGALDVGATPRNFVVPDTLAAEDLIITGAGINGAGGVTKTGAGTLSLNSLIAGAPLTVSAGTLALTSSTVTGALTVNGGTLATGKLITPGSFSAGSLAFGPGATTLRLKTGTGGDLITVGAFSTGGGTTTVNVSQFGGMLAPSVTPYPLINYTSNATGLTGLTLGALGHATATLSDNGTSIGLLVTANDRVIWDGTASTAWTTAANGNWKLQSTLVATDYIEGDDVIFQDAPTNTTVDIAASVSPSGVSFTNTVATTYTVTGAAGINGATGLTKTGNGTVILRTQNGYGGATAVNVGTLELDHDATGGVVLSATSGVSIAGGATLRITRDGTATAANTTFSRNLTGAGALDVNMRTGAVGTVADSLLLTGNSAGFSGAIRLLTPATGTYRLLGTAPSQLGTGSIEAQTGTQVFVTGVNTYTNNLTITGTGFSEGASGNIGALRLDAGAVWAGNIVVSGSARIGSHASTGTISGNISGGNLEFGATNFNNSYTTILTGTNSYGTTTIGGQNVQVAGVPSMRLNIGAGGITGSLGAGNVIINGDGANGVLGFDRSNGYTLAAGQTITGAGSQPTRVFLDLDSQGAGFNDNGNTITLGTAAVGGNVRIGVSRANAVATISGALTAQNLIIGNLNTAVPTPGATLNLATGAVVNVASISIAAGGGTAPLGNTANAALNIASGTTLNVVTTLWMGEQSGSAGNVTQSGGNVTVGGHMRIGHWPNNTSNYAISAGTLTLSGVAGTFPYTTGGTEQTGGIYVGVDGAGFLTQSGGTVTTKFLVLDNRADSVAGTNMPNGNDTYNLTGGTLVLSNAYGIITRNATSAVILNGGTVQAGAGISPALDTNKITVGAAGVTLDTNGANTFTLYGPLAGTGIVSVTGGGTLTTVNGGAGANITVGGTMPGGSLGTASVNIGGTSTVLANRTGADVWSGSISGTGTLLKQNTGTLILGGSGSGFTGTATVSAGVLAVPGNFAASINVGDGAALAGEPTATPNLTVGTATGGVIVFDPNTPGALTTTNLTLNGTSSVDFSSIPAGAAPWTVINYTNLAGAGTFALGPTYRGGSITTGAGVVQVNSIVRQILTWTGGTNGVWDINTTANNWNNASPAPDTFYNADDVNFGNGPTNVAVTLTGILKPWAVNVSAPSTNYTLTATAGNQLFGPIGVNKTGASTLTLVGPNENFGPTNIGGGSISIANPASLGGGALGNSIAFSNGGRLTTTAALDLGLNRDIIVNTGGGSISHNSATAANITIPGQLLSGGTDNISFHSNAAGAGTFILTGNNGGATGNISVDAPTAVANGLTILRIANAAAAPGGGIITLNYPAAAATTGNAVTLDLPGVTLPAAVGLNMTAFLNGAISQRSQVTSTGISSIDGPIALTGNAGSVIQFTPSAGTLTINGNITEATPGSFGTVGTLATLFLRNAGNTVVNGTINLPNALISRVDPTGIVTINSTGNVWAETDVRSNSTLRIGANNALAVGALLTIGQADNLASVFDMNGFSQEVNGLRSITGTANTTRGINNASVILSTLTLNGTIDRVYGNSTGFTGGNITGNIAIVKNGANTQTLAGPANTYTGNVTVNTGTLVAGGVPASNALGNPTIAGRTVTVNTGATLSLTTNNVYGDGRIGGNPLTPNNNLPATSVSGGTLTSTRYNVFGALTLNGATLTQSSTDAGNYEGYQFRGNVTVGGAAASTISTGNGKADHLNANTIFAVADATGSAAADLVVSAPLRNQSGDYTLAAGGLTKNGIGTMLLSAINTYTGATIVDAGTLLVTGSISGSAVTVNAGATLGGGGSTGPLTVNAGATLAPGSSPGILSTGTISLASTATLSIELGGTTVIAGTDYDQLNVTGGVSLGGSTLNVFILGGFTPQLNDTFLIILNDGADAIGGGFAGITDGDTVNYGGYAFTFDSTYDGNGDTNLNDVALISQVPEPSSFVSLLAGLGSLVGLQRFRRRR